MYNKVILIGNLTRDIELRFTPSGTAVAKFGLATNRVYSDPVTKEKKQEVMFIDITVFGRAAETSNQYLRKGSQVLIDGRLSLNQWTDQTGQKRSKHEVIAESVKFLGGRDSNQNSGGYAQPQNNYGQQQQQTQPQYNQQPAYNNPATQQNSGQNMQQQNNNIPSIDVDEEDIPF
jgi:single-strand DNA-binding protein